MSDTWARAVAVIEPHLSHRLAPRGAAMDTAELLSINRLLGCGLPDAQERVADFLHCVVDDPTAERIAADLNAAGLL